MRTYLLIITFSIYFAQTAISQISNPNINEQIKQAHAFERANMLLEATTIYNSILDEDPYNIYSIKKIKTIYRSNQDTTSIEHLLKRYDYNTINDPILLNEIMELQIWTGNSNWLNTANKIFTKFNSNLKINTLFIGRLINNGLIVEAVTYINNYRVKNNQLDFYSMELGSYYNSRMAYEDALIQYLLNLKYNPKNYRAISNRIMIFPDIPHIQNRIKEILQTSDANNAKIILSDIEFKLGNFDKSYEILSKNYTNPNELVEFTEQIYKIGLYDKAIEIYSDIIDKAYNIQITNASLMGIGRCLERKSINPKYILPISALFENNSILACPLYEIEEKLMGPIWNAIEIYDSLSHRSKEASLKLADIKFKGINDLDSSIEIYQNLLTNKNNKRKIKFDAGIHLIEALIVKGNLDIALNKIDELKKIFKRKEELYLIAIKELQINFYQGSIEESLAIINDLLQKISKDELIYNDILSFKSLILLFDNEHDNFYDYASIQLLIYQNKKMQALENLLEFINGTSSLITDISLYQLATLSLYFGDIDTSINQLNEIKNNSIYLEMSNILKAEIFDYIIDDKEEAVNMYLKILNTHPNSIHYENIRYRLREIAS